MRRLRLALLLAGGVVLTGAGAAAGAVQLGFAQEQPGPAAAQPPPVAPDAAAPASPDAAAAPPAAAQNATGESAAAPPDEATPPPAPAVVAAAPPEPPPPPPEPLKRPRLPVAVLQAADKVTAETLRFEARVGETVRYKGLVLTVHACETTAADEPVADSLVHLDIQSQPAPVPGRPPLASRQLFRGWMSAEAPSLNPLESPGYDVWLIACKADAPSAPAGKA